LIQSVLPQLTFSFYRQQPIHADFSGGQITSDAGLLPLRAFDQRHHLTRELAQLLSDPRDDDRVRHNSLTLLRQRLYQIVAGYEDANRLRHDPLLQIVADQKLGHALGSQPTLSRWKNAPSARDLVRLNDTLREQFIRLCGDQVRQRGEILLDIDSTDEPPTAWAKLLGPTHRILTPGIGRGRLVLNPINRHEFPGFRQGLKRGYYQAIKWDVKKKHFSVRWKRNRSLTSSPLRLCLKKVITRKGWPAASRSAIAPH
jgi:hypothetical protein